MGYTVKRYEHHANNFRAGTGSNGILNVPLMVRFVSRHIWHVRAIIVFHGTSFMSGFHLETFVKTFQSSSQTIHFSSDLLVISRFVFFFHFFTESIINFKECL